MASASKNPPIIIYYNLNGSASAQIAYCFAFVAFCSLDKKLFCFVHNFGTLLVRLHRRFCDRRIKWFMATTMTKENLLTTRKCAAFKLFAAPASVRLVAVYVELYIYSHVASLTNWIVAACVPWTKTSLPTELQELKLISANAFIMLRTFQWVSIKFSLGSDSFSDNYLFQVRLLFGVIAHELKAESFQGKLVTNEIHT